MTVRFRVRIDVVGATYYSPIYQSMDELLRLFPQDDRECEIRPSIIEYSDREGEWLLFSTVDAVLDGVRYERVQEEQP